MSIVERARVALRNWINKPTRAEQLYREQSRENMVREQLEGIARQFESEALSWHAKGEREYRNWLDAQRAWIERLEAEASARGPEVCGELDIVGEVNARGRKLLRAMLDEYLSRQALATAA